MEEQLDRLYLDCLPVYGRLCAKNMSFSSKESIMQAIKKWPKYLKYVDHQDEDMIMLAVRITGGTLKYAKHQTEEICITAICNDHEFCFELPFENTTYRNEFIHLCHSFYGPGNIVYENLKCLPLRYVKNQTEDIVNKAIECNPVNIKHVKDLSLDFARQFINDLNTLQDIPWSIRDQMITIDMITENPKLIDYVSKPTVEMIRVAVKDYPGAVEHAHRKLIDELYQINPWIVKHMYKPPEHLIQDAKQYGIYLTIPRDKYWDELKRDVDVFPDLVNPDEEMIWYAIKINPYYITHVKNPTEEMGEYVLSKNIANAKYLKKFTEEQKWRIIKERPSLSNSIDELTPDMKEYLIEHNYEAILHLDDSTVAEYLIDHHETSRRKDAITYECFKKHPCAIKYLQSPSEEDCLSAVKRYGLSLVFINEASYATQLHAVRQNGMALLHVKNKTREIILVALLQNPHAIIFLENPNDEYKCVACGLSDAIDGLDKAYEFLALGDETIFN